MLVTLVIVVFTYLFAVEASRFLYPNPEGWPPTLRRRHLPGDLRQLGRRHHPDDGAGAGSISMPTRMAITIHHSPLDRGLARSTMSCARTGSTPVRPTTYRPPRPRSRPSPGETPVVIPHLSNTPGQGCGGDRSEARCDASLDGTVAAARSADPWRGGSPFFLKASSTDENGCPGDHCGEPLLREDRLGSGSGRTRLRACPFSACCRWRPACRCSASPCTARQVQPGP